MFETINDDDIKFRADNIIEPYIRKINSFIDFKLSFLVKIFKEIIINLYRNYINYLNSINNETK